MGKGWILLIAVLIFALFVFLYWLLTHRYAKKEYGVKMWKHWPNRLSYWQAAVFYGAGFTLVTIFLLRWGNILEF